MFDVHCHINDEEFDPDRDEVLERARKVGLRGIIDSSLDAEEAIKSLEIARKHRGFVYPSFGLNPANLDGSERDKVIESIKEHADQIISIGEVGLDYWWVKDEEERLKQRETFRKFISLAKELDKPIVIHSRSAGKYAIEILLDEGAKRVMMHAFDGKVNHALKGVEAGFYFSIPPNVVRSEQKIKLVRGIPLKNLLLETDSPVLGPTKRERNEPANLPLVARKIAEIKGISEEEVLRVTLENTLRLFGEGLERSG